MLPKGWKLMLSTSKRSVRLFFEPQVYVLIPGADDEVNKYIKQVGELDDRVSDLEAIVRELEEWTGELGQTTLPPKPMKKHN